MLMFLVFILFAVSARLLENVYFVNISETFVWATTITKIKQTPNISSVPHT